MTRPTPLYFVAAFALVLIGSTAMLGARVQQLEVDVIADGAPGGAPSTLVAPWDVGIIVGGVVTAAKGSGTDLGDDPGILLGCTACVSGSSCCCSASGAGASCNEYHNPPGQRVVCRDNTGTMTCRSSNGCHCSSTGNQN